MPESNRDAITDVPSLKARRCSKIDSTVDKINIQEALKLRLVKGMTYADIGRRYNVSPQAVEQRLSRVFSLLKGENNIANLQAYKDNQSDFIDAAAMKMLSLAVEDARLKTLKSNQLIWNFGVLYDKSRISKGLSTSIIEHYDLTSDERDQLHKLEEMMITQDVVVEQEVTETIINSNE
jgi:hypothetical protein